MAENLLSVFEGINSGLRDRLLYLLDGSNEYFGADPDRITHDDIGLASRLFSSVDSAACNLSASGRSPQPATAPIPVHTSKGGE